VDADALLAALSAGDPAAFARIIRRFQRPLFSFLGRLGLSQGIAEEIAQETFLRAWLHRREFRPERAQFVTWLFSIGRNLALNELRSARHQQETTLGEAVVDLVVAAPGGAERVEEAQMLARLQAALHSLPFDDRSALGLAYVQELDMAAIAAIEQCSVAAVKTRLHRAKQKLRQLMEQQHDKR
jgi:RNA polymerase sigma-70 factor, ECF subfamily